MKIRDKLILAFGLYVLLASIFALFAYTKLRDISANVASIEAANEVNNSLLEARRQEKNFLLFRDSESIDKLKNHIQVLKKDLQGFKGEVIARLGEDKYNLINVNISAYEEALSSTIKLIYDEQHAAVELEKIGAALESGLPPEKLNMFFSIRSLENTLVSERNPGGYSSIHLALKAIAPTGRPAMDKAIDEYASHMAMFFGLMKAEADSIEKMRQSARGIEVLVVDLAEREQEGIDRLLDTSRKILLIGFATIVLLGIIVNLKMSAVLCRPLARLKNITSRIAQGDFTEKIDIEGGDEIASLASSFDVMQQRLRDTLESLEATISELKLNKEKLVNAEKLASLGILTAGIAHEINNPLTAVLTFSNLMLEDMAPDDPNRERMVMMSMEATKARGIVKDLLSFARETPLRVQETEINHLVRNVVESFAAQGLTKGIDVRLDLSEHLRPIQADPSMISQLVTNILSNACHAISPPGQITLSTAGHNGSVEMRFADTGHGIPAEHLSRIFDPFFSTKPVSIGTGLGLAVCYGIAKKHGGEISVESSVGEGTIFTVRLPANG